MTDPTVAESVFWPNLGLNVLGGFLASITFAFGVAACRTIYRRTIQRKAREFFGNDAVDGMMKIIFSEFEIRPEIHQILESQGGAARDFGRFPYRKRGETTYAMQTSRVLPICDGRGIAHLASVLGDLTRRPAEVSSDEDVRRTLDISFVSLGLGSNHKTRDVLQNPANRLLEYISDKDELTIGGKEIDRKGGHDYGVIAKIHPQQFPHRTWFICAGLNEWATSGAAWFLANKWRELHSRVGGKPFVALIRVRREQDESTELLDWCIDATTASPSRTAEETVPATGSG